MNRTKKNTQQPNTIATNDILLSDPLQIANAFNGYFVNVGPSLAGKIKIPKHSNHNEFATLEIIDRINTDMDNNEIPLNRYLDLSKAFGALDHNILLDKLHYYGIRNTPLDLFKNYLTNRKQYVGIDNVKSKMGEIQTGVPQGSILGPLLFII